MIAQIQALIAETERWRALHIERRDRPGMAKHDRERRGIEALACDIRLKALRECLRIAGGEAS